MGNVHESLLKSLNHHKLWFFNCTRFLTVGVTSGVPVVNDYGSTKYKYAYLHTLYLERQKTYGMLIKCSTITVCFYANNFENEASWEMDGAYGQSV